MIDPINCKSSQSVTKITWATTALVDHRTHHPKNNFYKKKKEKENEKKNMFNIHILTNLSPKFQLGSSYLMSTNYLSM